ncbi:MAG TPA: efflux RND transporter periplasmic adaptor subunit [Anaerolineales bacterium]|nr:efflux RND transporter periplasmic adaptor subunit [Anaerolineales bacterium]
MKSKRIWFIIGGVLLVVVAIAGVVVWRANAARQTAAAALETGEVTQITAVTSVESSGSIAAQQSGLLYGETTGVVGEVLVEVGDKVKKGDVLMVLDPATAPQGVIAAQSDLISAQKALDALLHPTNLAIANAQKAVADAQDALDKAERDLKSVQNPAGQSLYTAVSDAQLALDTAQANSTLARVGQEATAIMNAENDMNLAYSRLQAAQVSYDDCIKISCGERVWRENELNGAQNNYQRAYDAFQTAKLKYDTTVANQADDVVKAQDKYEDAAANLNAALRGPDANKLAIAQAKVAVAEANLADAQDKLNRLVNGADPKDIEAAQARVMAAQGTVDSLKVIAPFNGEVVAIGYQPGDAIVQGQAAVALANRSKLHVDVSVDESDVSQIAIGNPVTVTIDALPDLTLAGAVTHVNPLGNTVQGLVRYVVRVDLAEADPRVLISMTASVNIVTNTDEGALAVPLDAVQLDAAGEFVNRVKDGGVLERVDIKSGEVQGDLVVVTGPLQPGDKVQMVKPVPVNTGSPFGPG